MKSNYKQHWPLFISILVLLALVAISVWRVIERNGGHFSYALDDPYIHMAVARNFAEHGIWGTTPYGFNSATSSLIFPIFLALSFKLFGVQELLPLCINIIAALAILVLSAWILQRNGVSQRISAATLLVLVFALPMPLNIVIGMEHVIHALVSVAFFYLAAEILETKTSSPQKLAVFFTSAFLLSASRYEGLFLIAIVSALLLLRWRIWLALATAFWGALSVSIYGVYSLSQGSLFLPNSVYIKGGVDNANGLWGQIERILPHNILIKLYETFMLWPILVLLLLSIAVFLINKRKGLNLWWTRSNILVLVLIGAIILHVQFSMFLYTRYEAYLITMLILVIALLVEQIQENRADFKAILASVLRPQARFRPYLIAGVVLISLPFLAFGLYLGGRAKTLLTIPNLTDDIYKQQYQMGLFIREYYPRTPFAINDIGAVSFLNQTPILDLWGLGTIEIARVGGTERVSQETVWDLFASMNVHYAIIYDEWMKSFIPADWIEVGAWELEERDSAAHETVHFYAASASEALGLLENLKDYEASLPSGVLVHYTYP